MSARTVKFGTPSHEITRTVQRGSVKLTRQVKQAMRDWLDGRAYWQQTAWDGKKSTGFYCNRRGTVEHVNGITIKRLASRGPRAKWSDAAKAAFAGPDELHAAARTARALELV